MAPFRFVRQYSPDELSDLYKQSFDATRHPERRKPGRPVGTHKKAKPTRKARRSGPPRVCIPMTAGQRLYKHARDFADHCHELATQGTLGAMTRQRIITLTYFSAGIVARTTLSSPGHSLVSAGQCEWIADHMAVARECVQTLQAHPNLKFYPKTLPHLDKLLADIFAITHACRYFMSHRDPAPYGESRHRSTGVTHPEA